MEVIYCVKCKKRTNTNNITSVITKNNRTALTGQCEICGKTKYKFISPQKKTNTEVTLPNLSQKSQDSLGENILEKSISPGIATAVQEPA